MRCARASRAYKESLWLNHLLPYWISLDRVQRITLRLSKRQRAADMSKKTITGFYGAALLVMGLAVSAMPAYAGFQWVAPTDSGTYQLPAAPAASPSVATNRPEIISPVIISGDSQPLSPAPIYLTPAPDAKGKENTNLATATISVPAPAAGATVQGFASQIPLALALRQILPVGYNFSIDQDVSMDTLVSYKGGKPWRDTVGDMLATAGLAGREQGMTFTVSHVPMTVEADKGAIAPAPALSLSHSQNPALAMPYIAPVVAHDDVVPSFNVSSADGWAAERGDTLRKVLTEWCRRSNVELQWQAEYDYPVEASVHFSAGFEDAVRELLAGFDGARPQPIGELHANPGAGQKVLVVQARGNSYTN
jgi:hypothetical protein